MLSEKIKNTVLIAAALVLALSWQSCKKKETSFVSPLVNNKWRVVDAEIGSAQSFMIFNTNGRVLYLQSDSFNARSIVRGFFEDDGTTIALQMSSVNALKPVYSGDTCYLQRNATGASEYVLVKDNSAPDENTWVPEAVYVDSLQRLHVNGGCLAYYAPRLLEVPDYNDVGYYIDLTTKVSGSAALSQQVANFDINSLGDAWIAKESDANLYKINPSNFSTIFTSAAAPYRIDVIALGATSIYAYAQTQSILYTYNIAADNFDAGVNIPENYSDFALSGNYLYCTRAQYIDKLDLTTHRVVKTWRITTNSYLDGIATDGTYFYVESGYSFHDIGHILKLTLN